MTWTPDDHFRWLTATKEVQIYVYKADPQLDWQIDEPYFSGMALEMGRHLRACTRDLHLADGDMHYTPGPGSVLGAGVHSLSVAYIPPKAWRKRYNKVTKTIALKVLPEGAAPIQWTTYNRGALDWDETYGTRLSAKHLNAQVSGLKERSFMTLHLVQFLTQIRLQRVRH